MGRVLLATSNGTATAAAGSRLAGVGIGINYPRPTDKPTALEPKASLGPTIAVVISAVIVACFLLGFVTGYFKRCIWGSEATENVQRRNFASQRGLDPEIVTALPLVYYADLPTYDEQAGKKYDDCAVCLAVFDSTDSLRLLPRCSHAFHSDCIDEWFRSHTTCPLCRACLAHPDHGKAPASTENHDAERRGGIIVEVVIGGESSGASAAIISGIVSPDNNAYDPSFPKSQVLYMQYNESCKRQLWVHKGQTHLHKRSNSRKSTSMLDTLSSSAMHERHHSCAPSEWARRLQKRRSRPSGDRAPWPQASSFGMPPAMLSTAMTPNHAIENFQFTP